MQTIIAFDPGKSGGIAISCGDAITAMPMPMRGSTLDLAAISRIVKDHSPDLAIIEKVASRPDQGVVSMFTFGQGYGQLQGILAALDVPFYLITPQTWKAVVLPNTKKDKAAAIAYCERAYPKVSLVPKGCRVPHDGMADALCMMRYGQKLAEAQKNNNNSKE